MSCTFFGKDGQEREVGNPFFSFLGGHEADDKGDFTAQVRDGLIYYG